MAHSQTKTAYFAHDLATRTTLPALATLAINIAHVIVVWNDRAKGRKVLRNMSPEQLADIGITSAQAGQECQKRFWHS
ncbi:hypothetical protein GCM10008927_09290 [Amylibacter ulvae]|uniref:YjiS-like domain-containing protein n=1 Tax=Paramylibacter ulvae TaxID=1651968 RepID=A0ABQ3D191_9RHOB|nr:DUF1127 domain-containing protein [Amylibacter ulvae]GHA46226.1 hypothetical protein GCM10008927_09290 [Amylibacter ulvae]